MPSPRIAPRDTADFRQPRLLAATLTLLLTLAPQGFSQIVHPSPLAAGGLIVSETWPPATATVVPPTAVQTRRPTPQNCNLAIEVTEQFANRFVSRSEGRQGEVRDCVLGADVYGNQVTHTTTRLDFRPCDSAALVELQLLGQVNSSTVGVTQQAQIHSQGCHQMFFSKEIEFDGTVLKTRSPSAYIAPQQHNVAAATRAARVPILGPITGNIALRAADARKPVSTAITAGKITRQAGPQFTKRIDEELAKLNRALAERLRPRLEEFDLRPRQQFVSTTDQLFQWDLAIGDGSGPDAVPLNTVKKLSGNAATVSIHESLLNGTIARLPLGGVGIPDVAIDRWFARLTGTEGAIGDEGGSEPRLATIRFAEHQPIELRLEHSRAVLIVRVGFQPVTGPEIPPQEISIPFELEVTAKTLIFRPGEVSIAPVDPTGGLSLIDEAARQLIRVQVQERLSARAVPRRIPLVLPDAPRMELIVRDVSLRDGWLSVALDHADAEAAAWLDAPRHPFIMSTRRR